MRKLLISFFFLFTSNAFAIEKYRIEAAYNDEIFIINGEKFEAETSCLGWDEGDEVIFLDGSPNGVCSEAVLYNFTREDKCEVWCE